MEGWEVSSKRFVAFFDIMGFKDMVVRHDNSDIYKTLSELHESVLNPINEIQRDLEHFDTIDIQTVMFSDSIMLVSNKDTKRAAMSILYYSGYLLSFCLKEKIPVKGAISYGTMTSDFEKSIHFGQPLIDAYLLEEDLKLYGCVIDNNFEMYLRDNEMLEGLEKYKTPLKSGKVSHYNIDWTMFNNRHKVVKNITDIFDNLYSSVSGATRIYVDNTLDFYEEMKKKQNN